MKCFRVPITYIFCILYLVLLGTFHGNYYNDTAKNAQVSSFDATITSNQEEYYIYEEIIATFNFSSHITNEDYFAFAISENISFNPIYQSESIQGNFSISEIYIFSLLSLNYYFFGEDIVLYLLLYYFDDLFGNDICCYKQITICKANLKCDGPENFTRIEANTKYNLTFRLFDSKNSFFVLKEEEVTCWILFDNVIYDYFTLITTANGTIQAQIEPDKNAKNCEIHLICNTSRYFNSIQITFRLNVFNTDPVSRKIITILVSIFLIGIVFSCIVYFSILFYKKKLKRTYSIREIRI